MISKIRHYFILGLVGIFISASATAWASAADEMVTGPGLDTVWVLLAAFLVFFMQTGFGMVEAGFIRAKNTCNILTKNYMDYCIASLVFYLVGYALLFGKGNGFMGFNSFALMDAENPSGVPLHAFWLFQAAFCGAAATIVAGAMAERMKFVSYLLYTVVVSAVVYPLVGHWVWNEQGWLAQMGFADFAGSTVVHTTGGMAALAGTLVLGPRLGKFDSNGKPRAMPGHSIPLAALGVFLLWFGWFGFNAGSTLNVGDGRAISLIAVNTNLAAAAGAVTAMVMVWIMFGKPDLSMTMNGVLAGLVAVTAPCAFVSPPAAVLIGAVGGVIVVLGVALLDRVHVDDPVGAVPVHGLNGIWGTLAVGIWGQKGLGLPRDGLVHGGGFAQVGVQLLGALTATLFVVFVMGAVFYAINRTVGLRVSKEEERRGLDLGEHGMEAYSGFQVFVTQ